jgi:hypothetical protein
MGYYAAYGSNLNLDQMKRRCPESFVYGVATLQNYQLNFRGVKGSSYLTVDPKEGEEVPLLIWRITENDEKALDRYEGYPYAYLKRDVVVDIKRFNGEQETRKVMLYQMVGGRGISKPSTAYLDTCLEGYNDNNLDISSFLEAYSRSLSESYT